MLEERREEMEEFEEEGERAGANLELVIGVDCEGMSRSKNLALIQVKTSSSRLLFLHLGFITVAYLF